MTGRKRPPKALVEETLASGLLSVKDSAAFAKTMLAPPKPNRKLTQAFARHQQSVIVK